MYTLRNILFITAVLLLGASQMAYAQQRQDSIQGEIWMTEAELESFLTRIATRKKQQLQNRKMAQLDAQYPQNRAFSENNNVVLQELQRINDRIDFLYSNGSIAEQNGGQSWTTSDQTRSRNTLSSSTNAAARERYAQTTANPTDEAELARLQQRIEDLHTEIASLQDDLQATTTTDSRSRRNEISSIQRSLDNLSQRIQQQRTESAIARQIVVEGARSLSPIQTIPVPPIYIQPTDNRYNTQQPIVIHSQTTGVDSLLAQRLQASTSLNIQLQQQIDSLYSKLDSDQDSSEFIAIQQELIRRTDELTARIDQLSAPDTTSITALTEAEKQRLELKNYQHTVYFANNSTGIDAADLIALQQLGNIISTSPHRATVILRGFSSSVGNAAYNEQLSRRRAEAVQKVLLRYGLEAKHIVTLHHGADASKSDDMARRVEVTLSIY